MAGRPGSSFPALRLEGAKFVRQIEFAAEDRLGFWEVRGYSSTADPWTEDRFVGEAIAPPRKLALIAAFKLYLIWGSISRHPHHQSIRRC
jgi:hypothetical protein